MAAYEYSNKPLKINEVYKTVQAGETLKLSDEAIKKIQDCRDFLEQKIFDGEATYYGINTGFGSLCDVKISRDDLGDLQENLVKSHAAGTGDQVPAIITKLMVFLKIKSLSSGHSGITQETVQRLIELYNANVIPVVYEMGSLGASGDLAPLAHLSLPIIGEGKVVYENQETHSTEILNKLNMDPLRLKAKEGLALLNGTQFMSAYGVWAVYQARQLLNWADMIAAISVDGYMSKIEPYNPLIHRVRPHNGQITVARNLLRILEGSEIAAMEKEQVQDPYSFRCIPQVHGASRDALAHVADVVEREINSVTDNPNIFPGEDQILSGGNFHGQHLALVLDYLAIAMSELGSISERRTYKMLSGNRDLPAFLVAKPGLNSGLMIPQYTAAALCSQNKTLCTPASADSITSSNGQEDHVSMGANAAVKLYKIINNLKGVLSIELLTATQALDFRRPKKSSEPVETIFKAYREHVPFVQTDRVMHDAIESGRKFLEDFEVGKYFEE